MFTLNTPQTLEWPKISNLEQLFWKKNTKKVGHDIMVATLG
jgi:hypothetical protein